MPSSRTWHGVTPGIFACVKETSARDHGTKYQPAGGDKGTATTKTEVGTIVLDFHLDATGVLTYTIRKKPVIVPASRIWNGINDTINGCRK